MRVAIRVDAAAYMGSGHVQRCATLATALRAQGARVEFFCRDLPGNYIGWLRQNGDDVHVLAAQGKTPGRPPASGPPHGEWLGVSLEDEIREMTGALQAREPFDWLVVDHYALGRRWESAMRPRVHHLFAIDDLADRRHDVDLLLDQGLPADPARYDGLLPPGAGRLLGPAYALLRPEFSLLRQRMPSRSGALQRLLVFLGGSDPGNLTGKVLEGLALAGFAEREIDVVMGSGCPHLEAVRTSCAALAGCRLHVQTPHMADLMLGADLMIGASGGVTWERLCLGLPAIIVPVAENQVAVARAVASRRLGIVLENDFDLDPARLAALLRRLDGSPSLLRRISERARKFVDGEGVNRVVAALLALNL